ncbi:MULTISPECIES: FHA domain-containing protein [Pseudomonas]|uniref:FHA domain-containing protein n=1 Tax=Pseudomonas TaxID=286 RepID=UPI002188BE19|nr:FHA domain-containing protein [Pseudomonas sp. LRP2-20]BDM24167.1 FHA domain-containing protein [Pseudomonas sp. LRP2-20]
MSNTTDIDSIRTITLNITNPERLQLGCIARRQFDRRGGTIGSEAACWQLVDVDHQVAPVHCEIRWVEGRFCIIDYSNRTFMNDDHRSLDLGTPRVLLEGDRFQVGRYQIQVNFQDDRAGNAPLDELLATRRNSIDALLAEMPVHTDQPHGLNTKPIADIHALLTSETRHDPLKALDALSQSQEDPLQHLIANAPSKPA